MGMVGARGFEPPTSSSRTMRATKLRHAPTEVLVQQSPGIVLREALDRHRPAPGARLTRPRPPPPRRLFGDPPVPDRTTEASSVAQKYHVAMGTRYQRPIPGRPCQP